MLAMLIEILGRETCITGLCVCERPSWGAALGSATLPAVWHRLAEVCSAVLSRRERTAAAQHVPRAVGASQSLRSGVHGGSACFHSAVPPVCSELRALPEPKAMSPLAGGCAPMWLLEVRTSIPLENPWFAPGVFSSVHISSLAFCLKPGDRSGF